MEPTEICWECKGQGYREVATLCGVYGEDLRSCSMCRGRGWVTATQAFKKHVGMYLQSAFDGLDLSTREAAPLLQMSATQLSYILHGPYYPDDPIGASPTVVRELLGIYPSDAFKITDCGFDHGASRLKVKR